jgi:chromosome segregation ATPase
LKSKINLLEGQLESQRRRTRSVEEERDEAVKRLAASLNEFEGLKSENKNLKAQIASLRKQFEDSLKPAQVPKPSVKDRVKERVESERKKDSAIKKAPEHRKTEPNFINV